ncbi:Ribose-5-phosphate isomerase [Reticulomyxa filosa]|uniref:ribose-5-phosphate isomerase n=1 Tax=Reticulomyxa filosa TaxID=46433 RepID=X6MIV2_RETFI|nr:Ribose-5-phosphate isomerase [Reticulomyxa filosa]|eukprot:ETO12990.1 Ribose-5-phosphate isomerase [Reticulomyxa filosa]
MTSQDAGKKAAAEKAVLDNITSDMGLYTQNKTIGIGSGSTIVYACELIGKLWNEKKLTKIKCVATSFQSEELVLKSRLPLGNLKEDYNIDVAIDGADEVDESLNCIKGGGACHVKEKMVAYNAKKVVIVADSSKQAKHLGQVWKKGIPIAVLAESRNYVRHRILAHVQQGSTCELRMSTSNKAGPVVTDEGLLMLDLQIANIRDYTNAQLHQLDTLLHGIPGVVGTGFFSHSLIHSVYFGFPDGRVLVLQAQSKQGSLVTTVDEKIPEARFPERQYLPPPSSSTDHNNKSKTFRYKHGSLVFTLVKLLGVG